MTRLDVKTKICKTLREYELLALSRMTGEQIEDELNEEELKHYRKLWNEENGE
jgi:hypothetical protein